MLSPPLLLQISRVLVRPWHICSPGDKLREYMGHQRQALNSQDRKDSWLYALPRGDSFQCWFHSTQNGDIRRLNTDWQGCRGPGGNRGQHLLKLSGRHKADF